MKKSTQLTGHAICVLTCGFVYVGRVTCDKRWCTITEAKNLRRWGTTDGLGQLALTGPTDDTAADPAGTVRAPMAAVVHLLDTEESLWKS